MNSGDMLASNGSDRTWNSSARAVVEFKFEFQAWAIRAQRHRCAYCERLIGDVARQRIHIEHFVPKGLPGALGRWTFEVMNLSLACVYCNELCKSDFNPIASWREGEDYRKVKFLVCHPVLDDLRKHIRGGGAAKNGEVTSPVPLTPKGVRTIELFGLDRPEVRHALIGDARMEEVMEGEGGLDRPMRRKYSSIRHELGLDRI